MTNRVRLLAALAGSIVVLDLLTKILVVATLSETTPPDQQPRILGGLVYFSLLRNSGAAFSLATGMTWVLALVALVVVVAIIRIAPRLKSTWWAVALGLVLGGALGNLIDRIFRAPGFMRGHVVDFVSLFGPNAEYFPAFNVADAGISIGGALLVLTAIRGIDYDGTRSSDSARGTTAVGSETGDDSRPGDSRSTDTRSTDSRLPDTRSMSSAGAPESDAGSQVSGPAVADPRPAATAPTDRAARTADPDAPAQAQTPASRESDHHG